MFSAGIWLSWPAPTLLRLQGPFSELPVTSGQGGWLVSAMLIGSCLGLVLTPFLVDRIGRKWFLYTAGPTYLLSWILVYAARSYATLLAARYASGVAVGVTYAATSIYLSEIAETRIRAGLNAVASLAVCLGMTMMSCVGPWWNMKTVAMINAIPAIIFLVAFPWMPETPYHHVKKSRFKAARESLEWLRGTVKVDDEMNEISRFVEEDANRRGSFAELMTIRANRRASFVSWLFQSANQLSGDSALISYMNLIVKDMGLSIDPNIFGIALTMLYLIAAVVSVFIVDRVGRRPVTMFSITGMCACLFALGTYYYFDDVAVRVHAFAWIPLTALASFGVLFSLGLGQLSYTILGEIYPTSVKALATMIMFIYRSLLGAAVSKAYQIVVDEWGHTTIFYTFFVSETAFGLLIYYYLPETGGKTFADIQKALNLDTFGTLRHGKLDK